MSTPNPTTTIERGAPKHRSRIWLIVVAGLLLQLAAWTAWFIIASHHPVAEVPLTTTPSK